MSLDRKVLAMDKAIENYPEYTINELGEVKHNGKIIKPCDNGRGYLKVFVVTPDGRKSIRIHRLVAEAFLPNPDGLPVVNHIDGNKYNNRASNLEWVTHQQNTAHWLSQTSRRKIPVARLGKKGQVLDIFLSVNAAAKYCNCDYRSLYEALKNNRQYKGQTWRYCEVEVKRL